MASNNMTGAYQKIFGPLVEGNSELHQKNAIHLERKNKSLFEKLELESSGAIVYGFNYAYLTDGSDYYLTLINITFEEDRNLEFNRNLIEYVEECKESFFVYLASKDLLKIRISEREKFLSDRLEKEEEEKDFQYYGTTGVRRHEYENINSFFENFSIFKIPSESIFFNCGDEHKTILYLMTIHLNLKTLPYSNKTIETFQAVALSSANEIPYKYICEAFIAPQFKYAYKDLYRCIENLYGVEIIKKLVHATGIKCNIDTLREGLENILGWRPKELESFIGIMETVDIQLLNGISNILDLDNSTIPWLTDESLKKAKLEEIDKLQSTPGKSFMKGLLLRMNIKIGNSPVHINKEENIIKLQDDIQKIDKDILIKKAYFCATRLYSLRNSLVHYRKGLESKKIEYSDLKMEGLIAFLLKIIDELYRKN